MRRVGGVLAAGCAAALAAPGSAAAGTYDVVSCRAPGADGVNRAWTPVFRSFNGGEPDKGFFDVYAECPGPRTLLLVRSLAAGTAAYWSHSANLQFDAPAGTTIARVRVWRQGQTVRGGDGTDEWDVFAETDDGPLAGESCGIAPDQASCGTGAPEPLGGRTVTNASLATHDVDTRFLRYGVVCAPASFKSCPTANGAFPLASMNLWGSVVTIRDEAPPTLAIAGPLTADGWRRPGDGLEVDAADSAGIRAVHAQVGGAGGRLAGECDARRPAPCGARLAGPLGLSAPPLDGAQPLTVTATDAAGNQTTTTRTVAIDGTPPGVALARPRDNTIIARVTDFNSGFAAGQIEVRGSAAEPFRALPTAFRKGALRARMDRGRASRADVRVTVRDTAGNEAAGTPARFIRSGVAGRRVRAGRAGLPFGRRVALRGRLLLPNGRPLAGVPVSVTSQPRGGAPFVDGQGSTDARGRFGIVLRAGPARNATVSFAGGGGVLRTERRIFLAVRASSTIRASRTRLRGAGRVRFSGRVRGGAGAGLVVILQGRERGRWRTFESAATGARGRWRTAYRFRGNAGTYPIRALVRKQRGLAYERGYSRTLRIRVT